LGAARPLVTTLIFILVVHARSIKHVEERPEKSNYEPCEHPKRSYEKHPFGNQQKNHGFSPILARFGKWGRWLASIVVDGKQPENLFVDMNNFVHLFFPNQPSLN
jgi:hypothetical protein